MDFETWDFSVKFLTRKASFLSFEREKWNFTIFGPPREKPFRLPLENSTTSPATEKFRRPCLLLGWPDALKDRLLFIFENWPDPRTSGLHSSAVRSPSATRNRWWGGRCVIAHLRVRNSTVNVNLFADAIVSRVFFASFYWVVLNCHKATQAPPCTCTAFITVRTPLWRSCFSACFFSCGDVSLQQRELLLLYPDALFKSAVARKRGRGRHVARRAVAAYVSVQALSVLHLGRASKKPTNVSAGCVRLWQAEQAVAHLRLRWHPSSPGVPCTPTSWGAHVLSTGVVTTTSTRCNPTSWCCTIFNSNYFPLVVISCNNGDFWSSPNSFFSRLTKKVRSCFEIIFLRNSHRATRLISSAVLAEAQHMALLRSLILSIWDHQDKGWRWFRYLSNRKIFGLVRSRARRATFIYFLNPIENRIIQRGVECACNAANAQMRRAWRKQSILNIF